MSTHPTPPPASTLTRPTYSTTARNLTSTSSFAPPTSTTYTSLSTTLSKTTSTLLTSRVAKKMNDLVDSSGSEIVLKRVSQARKLKQKRDMRTTRRNLEYNNNGEILNPSDSDSDPEEMSKSALLSSIGYTSGIQSSHINHGKFIPSPPPALDKENAARMFFSAGMVMKDAAASNGNENGREKIKMTTLQKLQAASGNSALAKFKKAAKTAVEEEKADHIKELKEKKILNSKGLRRSSKDGMLHDKFEDKNRLTFSPGGTLKRDINESPEPVRVTFNTNGEVERSSSPITSPKKKKEKFVCLSSHKEEHRVTGMLRAVRGEAKKSIIRKKVHDKLEVNKVSDTIKEAEKEEKGEKKKRLARVRNLINASRRLSEGVTTEEVTRNKTDNQDNVKGNDFWSQKHKLQDHEYEKRSRKESVSSLMHHLHHHEIKKDEEKSKVIKGKIAKEWFGMSEKVILRNLKDLPSCYIPLITTAVSLGNGFIRILEFIESREDCKLISEDYSSHRIGEIVDTFCYEDGEKIVIGPGKPYLAIYKYKKGKKIIVKGLKTVEEEEKESSLPSWAYEVKEKKNVKKIKCEGDFCNVPGGGRCFLEPDECFTVLGRSLVKSKQDRGIEVPSIMLRPAKMNQGHKVCKACHDEYVSSDMCRMVKAREKIEREEKEQEEKERMKNRKEKGWKSRMQIELEEKLKDEKEKVRLLMLKKKQAKWKIEQQVRAKSRGVSVSELSSDSSSSDDEEGESLRHRLKAQKLLKEKLAKKAAKKSDGHDDSSSSDSESSEDEAAIAARKAEKKEFAEIRHVERAEMSKIRSLQTKVIRMRRVTDAFATNHSPSKLKAQMKKKVEEAKKSFKERRQSMANTTTTFSKVMLLLKNKRALEGAGVTGLVKNAGGAVGNGMTVLREVEEGGGSEEKSEDEEDDDEVGEEIRKSIIQRAMAGTPK
ncbi:hypothetical protein TrLO_g11886 [Triparma laevis f. longispina]|uniref:Uncharacterized protein n=1 Tax=Triparma laevis f. longispina TaxID=1714387 RepID=A0A9W7FV51_9STRA|nr:hypothetical protein TrLO_g11886 [Triparma laevis f. longispina]